MRFNKNTLAVLAAAGVASAQTSTSCNPTEKTCSADTALDKSTYTVDFTQGSDNSSWTYETGTSITYGDKGAEFIIAKSGEAPTIYTDFYFFFGYAEVKMQAAKGTGIVSSIVLESDDLDEIDWEFLGGDTTQAETNYFGKGNTTTYNRAIYYDVTTPQDEMHTYAVNWTSASLIFSIDGVAVRTLLYEDALDGKNYPQTPMRLKLGIWDGGAADEATGTVEWAGGYTNFDDAPFTMYVESVTIVNANPGTEYIWKDKTGDYTSIETVDAVDASSSDDSSSTSSSAATSTAATSTSAAAKTTTTKSAATTTTKVSAANKDADSTSTSTVDSTTVTTSTKKSSSTSSSSSSSNSTSNSSATVSSGVATQTTSAATSNAATALFTVLSLAVCFWML